MKTCSERHVFIPVIKSGKAILKRRESSLGYKLRCVFCSLMKYVFS